MCAAAVLTGGTVLRAAARVVFGWGDREDPLLSPEPPAEEEEPEDPGTRLSPALLFGPTLALLVAAVGIAFTPGLGEEATGWAHRLQDRPSHAAEVLAGKLPPAPPPAPVHPGLTPYAYGAASLLGALALAACGLYRRRLPGLVRRWSERVLDAPVAVLKDLHSGVVGDYVAWLTFGAATVGGLVSLLLR